MPPLAETPSQTAGPYLHIGLAPRAAGIDAWRDDPRWDVLAGPGAAGERIRLEGVILDGAGTLVTDALVEIWQANAHGKHHHPEDRQDRPVDPAFRCFGRAAADFATGSWAFETVKPGAVPGPGGAPMAPHVSLAIFARGINVHLHTRAYFEDEAEANARDPVLRSIEPSDRRGTLLARRGRSEGGFAVYRFDIRLQGESETVFFDA
jgi:protocatechuate 3,4-dioxygenase alpha subunit